MDIKNFLNKILTNKNLSINEKYKQIIEKFPDYLQDKELSKAIYKKIEGIFHDGLGT